MFYNSDITSTNQIVNLKTDEMTEQEQKHWFELGKKVERSNRTYFTSFEFWIGFIIGFCIMYLLLNFTTP